MQWDRIRNDPWDVRKGKTKKGWKTYRGSCKLKYSRPDSFRFKRRFFHIFYGVNHQYDSIGHQHGINDHVDVRDICPHNHRGVSRRGFAFRLKAFADERVNHFREADWRICCSIWFWLDKMIQLKLTQPKFSRKRKRKWKLSGNPV